MAISSLAAGQPHRDGHRSRGRVRHQQGRPVTGVAASFLVGLAQLSGCLSSQPRDLQYQPDEGDLASARATLSYKFAPKCNEGAESGGGIMPSRQYLPVGSGPGVIQGCGLIAAEITTSEFLDDFVKTACDGADSPECGTTYVEMFYARLKERYALTNWEQVLTHCKAYPAECKAFRNFETWSIESHNAAVDSWARQAAKARAEADDRAYRAEAERRQALWAALAAGADAFLAASQGTTIRCTAWTTAALSTVDCKVP